MRHAATRAPTLPDYSGFVKFFQHEWFVLATLPAWHLRLFGELLVRSDYRTGVGTASVPDLVVSLQPIQPRTGPKHYAPNVQAIKKAIRGFESRLILARDKRRSDRAKVLHYLVAGRNAKPRPDSELDPLIRTPVNNRKAKRGAAYRPLDA